MKKTSLYLTEEQAARLKRIADAQGRPQAEVLRDALAAYHAPEAERGFACDGVAEGPGGSVADLPERELLEGFGE